MLLMLSQHRHLSLAQVQGAEEEGRTNLPALAAAVAPDLPWHFVVVVVEQLVEGFGLSEQPQHNNFVL